MRSYFLMLGVAFASSALAAEVGQSGFTYQGRVFDSSNQPMSGTVDITLEIMSPNGCVLYAERQQGINLSSSYGDGYFAVQVGSATSATKRIAPDPNQTMAKVFSNDSGAWSGIPIKDSYAANCSYSPAAGDARALRVKVLNPLTGGTKWQRRDRHHRTRCQARSHRRNRIHSCLDSRNCDRLLYDEPSLYVRGLRCDDVVEYG